jgi:hypothetical protein
VEPTPAPVRSIGVGFGRTVVVSAPNDSGRRRFAVPSLQRHSFDPNSLKLTLTTAGALGLFALAPLAGAQSTIYGMDVRIQRFFQTDIANFVANFTVIAPNNLPIFALDFDATATTLWGVQNPVAPAPAPYGTFDLTTGVFTQTGTLTGPASAAGLTAHPNGTTWYVLENLAGTVNLWRGNIATSGTFTLVGSSTVMGLAIDISCDSQGNLYANSITTDSLYSIDPNTGAATLIGPTGFATNFAQGMDFDWSTDTLYATLYTGGGTGGFCTINLATGAATQLEDTLSLNAEMEIAIQVPSSQTIGTNYCTAVANSTGNTGVMSATGSTIAANNDVTLTASSLPNNANGFFLTSTTQGFVMNPGGSAGNLCLAGSIGRYVGPGQVQNTGLTGSISLALNLTQTPTPTGFVSITAGQTWNFTAWHRDAVGGVATSNFADGLEIAFN